MSQESYQAIKNWLNNLDTEVEGGRAHNNKSGERVSKRRRLCALTPPLSNETMDNSTSPRKRSRPDPDVDTSDLQTPRPQRISNKRVQAPRSGSAVSLSSSQRSGRSSPRKQLVLLSRNIQGVQTRPFSELLEEKDSAELRDFLDAIDAVSDGDGIVPPTHYDLLRSNPSSRTHFGWIRRDGHFSLERDKVGHTPSPEAVLDILDAAAECSQLMAPEVTWNLEVHQSILHLGLRSENPRRWKHLVNFKGCSSASILPEYLQGNAPSKKVDFCIYVDPRNEADKSIPIAISQLTAELPDAVFNHTSELQFRDSPIAIGIETKKTGEEWSEALLQLGVWQSAHWSFLRRLVAMRRQQAEAFADTDASGSQSVDADAIADHDLELPTFIPGLVIQGHDWHLVLSTLDDQQTVMWDKVTLGSTTSTKGIYQIILALQVLRQWIETSYWPWLRQLILGFGLT